MTRRFRRKSRRKSHRKSRGKHGGRRSRIRRKYHHGGASKYDTIDAEMAAAKAALNKHREKKKTTLKEVLAFLMGDGRDRQQAKKIWSDIRLLKGKTDAGYWDKLWQDMELFFNGGLVSRSNWSKRTYLLEDVEKRISALGAAAGLPAVARDQRARSRRRREEEAAAVSRRRENTRKRMREAADLDAHLDAVEAARGRIYARQQAKRQPQGGEETTWEEFLTAISYGEPDFGHPTWVQHYIKFIANVFIYFCRGTWSGRLPSRVEKRRIKDRWKLASRVDRTVRKEGFLFERSSEEGKREESEAKALAGTYLGDDKLWVERAFPKYNALNRWFSSKMGRELFKMDDTLNRQQNNCRALAALVPAASARSRRRRLLAEAESSEALGRPSAAEEAEERRPVEAMRAREVSGRRVTAPALPGAAEAVEAFDAAARHERRPTLDALQLEAKRRASVLNREGRAKRTRSMRMRETGHRRAVQDQARDFLDGRRVIVNRAPRRGRVRWRRDSRGKPRPTT